VQILDNTTTSPLHLTGELKDRDSISSIFVFLVPSTVSGSKRNIMTTQNER
jgi:hypothetical protein